MALKQHIVIKDSEILEAVQTASLQWNYFSSRFYDSPSQVLKVRPLGLAWLLLQYDWDNFDTDSLLSSLAMHEEWKGVPCVLFYRESSVAKAQKASQLFPKIQAIVPVPLQAAHLVDVFRHLLDPNSVPIPTSFAGPDQPKPQAHVAPVSNIAIARSTGILPPSNPPPHTQLLGLTKTGSFAPPRMPAPPPTDVVAALPGTRAARPASPFLAFKATSSLPQLSRHTANSPSKAIPTPKVVSTPTVKPTVTYNDVALPKLPVFTADPTRLTQKQEPARPPALPQTRPSIPAPEAAPPKSTPPPPGEDARYANLSLSKLRNTQSLPAYVPSAKAVALKPQLLKDVPQAPQNVRATHSLPPPPLPPQRSQSVFPSVGLGAPAPAPLSETSAWSPELLSALETKLAELVGPLARILLRKAARAHSTWPELYNAILGHISSPEDKQDFSSFCASLPINGNKEPKDEDESYCEEADNLDVELSPDLIRFFEESLQDYLGAVGKVVLRQQLNDFKGMGAFVRGMAAQITIPGERTEFLERTVAALKSL